jgi:hypothetical protein
VEIDIRSLTPTQLVRLINSTPMGAVVNASKVNRQMNEAGLRITAPGDSRRVDLVKYVAWLARKRDEPRPQTVGYEEKLRRDLERQLTKSRQGRDIGSIPQVVSPDRRARCEGSFRAFCETYFPQAFRLKWSDDHLRVIDKIERAVLEGGLFAFAMPRGSGKTSLARVAAMWAVLYGFRDYVCIIGSAEDMAKMVLGAIRRDMASNDLLLEDFPEAIYPLRKLENNARKQIGQLCDGEPTNIIWAADKLVMPTIPGPRNSPSSGAIITVAGLDSNIRGQQHTKMDGTIIRPSLVILDDPQTRQSAASRSQTKHRLAILNGDVLGMAGPDVKIAGFMPCTKIYHDDLADQILSREKNPEWQGECTKMVYAFPADETRWDQYAELRAQGLREGDGGKRATEFYAENREAMDAGSLVAWPQRYNIDELSAIQHAMNLRLRDEAAFFAEYQNEPIADQADEGLLTPDQVAQRVNGRPRFEVPQAATNLTMFIDVHDKLLFYAVCAWEPDFTGYVIDYGTYPDQKRRLFTLRDATKTLGGPQDGIEGAIHAGIEALATDYLSRSWQMAGTGAMRIEKCLIDAGYMTGVIGNVCHKLPATVMPSKGVGITAGKKPMSAYQRKPGEKHGHNWYVPNVSRTRELRHVQYDTNYWKTFIHARLSVAPGDRGALTLYGKSESEHRLFADHIAASETWTRTEGNGRVVQEWSVRPSRPDNHWLDCLVGCAVAASMCGVSLATTEIPGSEKKKRMLTWEAYKREVLGR